MCMLDYSNRLTEFIFTGWPRPPLLALLGEFPPAAVFTGGHCCQLLLRPVAWWASSPIPLTVWRTLSSLQLLWNCTHTKQMVKLSIKAAEEPVSSTSRLARILTWCQVGCTAGWSWRSSALWWRPLAFCWNACSISLVHCRAWLRRERQLA